MVGRVEHVGDTAHAGLLQRGERRLLLAFDLPVDGCAYLNDRDRLLARWTP